MDLTTPIASGGFLYKRYATRLEKLGIYTLADLLYHIPRRYEDLSRVIPISQIKIGETVTIQGVVEDATIIRTKRGFSIQKIKISDNTGSIDLTFFNQPYIVNVFKEGKSFSVSGRVGFFSKKVVLQTKSYEEILDVAQNLRHTGKLIPIYPETHGITSKWFRNRISELLDSVESFPDFLPEPIKSQEKLPSLVDALRKVHLPQTLTDAEEGKKRLAFDELFLTHLEVLERKNQMQKNAHAIPLLVSTFQKDKDNLISKLPFELTPSQKTALADIETDLSKSTPMNRMLEGDVGSGKTIISAISMYLVYKCGFQSVLMAPTEILARQHFETISKILTPLGVKIVLVTSATRKAKADEKEADIAIGTHALLHSKINLKKLVFVVIDEQQRFGVEQRAKLAAIAQKSPHTLTMTATPIPRSIALTIYGDLSLSYLKDLPKGRIIVKTWVTPKEKREKGYEWIKQKLRERENAEIAQNQVFVVCPFIDISENMDTVKAAKDEYERLKNDIFTEFTVELLHGKMTQKEKDHVLEKFREGRVDVLVSTPVVEVGIDIPNATIMIIEGAERFGLSQLHQLRGRVGRRSRESFCFLFTSEDSESASNRLKYLETVHNGAELAEVDLALRGPGQIYGTLQHGSAELSIASFSDKDLIEQSRLQAEKVFHNLSSYPDLQERVKSTIIHNIASN